MSGSTSFGPLTGLRVLEIGHFVAAPFCTRILGDLGADVVKVEPPGGDPVRDWGAQIDGNSLWWSAHGRNKRSVTLNLKAPKARDIVLGLVRDCDVVVENFRPGQLERMGLGDEALRQARPDLVIAHISGYGQDGPYRDRAAFGVIGEAIGGLRHLTDHAPGTSDLPPVRVGVSIGDSLAGLYAAFGIVASVWQRDRGAGDGRGRTLDVALTEAVLSMMEGMLPEYGALGKIRQPTGSRIPTAAPSSAYPCSDGKWILIAANSDPLFKRLSTLIGWPTLPDDPKFADNRARVDNVAELDSIIATWTRQLPVAEVGARLGAADIPSTQVYSAAECAADPQFRHRGMVREVEDRLLGKVLHAGIVPNIPDDPGAIRWTGPSVGEHTEEVLGERLGLGRDEIAALRAEGVV
ncbi:MAG: CoA transferase [Rhizobiaceae bacterium]|nr:CoA transferase [Rhizobiaceae bacterium]MCV0404942.1 CoA transferase [Rhizobiaceae bacterium]